MTLRLTSLRVAVSSALLAGLAMAAECPPHVGDTFDLCVAPPPDYPGQNLEDGEPCYFAQDCNSGLCVPDFEGEAFCAPRTLSTGTCLDALESETWGYAAMVTRQCGGDDLVPTCTHTDAITPAVIFGQDEGQACFFNEQCDSGFCYDEDNDAEGVCVSPCIDQCGTGEECLQVVTNSPDPFFLCVPEL